MITEDYVSFEIAKLLKEKGFYSPYCYYYYFPDIESKTPCISDRVIDVNEDKYLAPTLQMAMKWLREVHHLHIVPEISDVSRLNPQYYVVIWLTTSKRESYILELFNSYEEAVEEGIRYTLKNLIQ